MFRGPGAGWPSSPAWRVEGGLLAEHGDQLGMGGMFHQLGVDLYALQKG
ncbi:hypothetical protein [Streptomyces flaveolus]